MKTEWLVADVTSVRSPGISIEPDILGMIPGIFLPIQATCVVGEPLCDVNTPF